MAVMVEQVPGDIDARAIKLSKEPEDQEAKEVLTRLIQSIQYEQTGRSLIDTLIMTDMELTKFFDILRANWTDGDNRILSLLETKGYHHFGKEVWELEREGFVGIREKLWCQECGGVVTDIPEFSSLTLIHTWMNPICPAFLGQRDSLGSIRGNELTEYPEINQPDVREALKKLMDSNYPMHNRRMSSAEACVASCNEYPDPTPVELKNRVVEAGWYAEAHPTGSRARCFCCGIEKGLWRPEDCLLMVHLTACPGCPYLHAIMDKETIKEVLAGHKSEVPTYPQEGMTAFNYFKKMVFPPQTVNYERIGWDRRSTRLQKESDERKSQLISEWIVYQRTHSYAPEDVRNKRRRLHLDRKQLMRNYQWQTRRIDINTKVGLIEAGKLKPFRYTPNWKREERFISGWGLGFPCNRSAALRYDHLLIED